MADANTMAADVAAAPAEPTRLQQIRDNFNKLSQRQKMAGAAALALAIAMVVGVLLWTKEPDYSVLFSNFDDKDGGAIVAALQQQNVPYRFSPNGSAIMVPSSRVHELRLRMAAQGIPKGGNVGFELMENQKFGMSQFHEQVTYQRALEGELARTIQAIASVDAARVHLAMPKQTAFLRDEQKPTASIFVTLRPGRVLDKEQVAGIVHLVSSSVPRLSNDQVSIVDQNGNLLTSKPDPLRIAGMDPNQLKYVQEVEAAYIRRIETILAPIMGPGNYKVQATADIDFNQTEQTAETYRPNPSPEQAIRSQQTTESSVREGGPQGVPGALTNQPPVPATAPITNPPVGANAAPLQTANVNRSATINYELDRTIQHVRQSVGQVRRLSVAVVVNHRQETDAKGQTRSVPLSDAELARITQLVREAMGFNQARGDSLNVATSAFAADDGAQTEQPLWKDPEMIELAKEALKYLLVLVALMMVYFGVIRPLIKSVLPPPPPPPSEQDEAEKAEPGEAGEEEEEEEGAEVTLSEEAQAQAAADDFETRLARARELARANPRLVANLVKEWIGANEEGRK